MPRPKNKEELTEQSQQNFEKLISYIDQFSLKDQNKEFSIETRNRNIRDVLAHLFHWNLLFIEWYQVGMAGGKPDMPAKGYSWKTTPELNRWVWEKYRAADLEKIKREFTDSHCKVQGLIEKHTNDELFRKKRYKWTGSTSLGAYLVSCTSSHYDWALKLIKKGMK